MKRVLISVNNRTIEIFRFSLFVQVGLIKLKNHITLLSLKNTD
jgi:hypothetical protein